MTFKKGQTAWNKGTSWSNWMSKEGKEKSLSNLKPGYNLGKKASPELKKKLSEAQKKAWKEGKYKDAKRPDISGENNPFFGKKHTEEVKAIIKEKRKNQKFSKKTRQKLSDRFKGSNSVTWKGGITPLNMIIRGSFKMREWRTKVFKRDNYTCQDCGQWGGKLQAHHKKPFSKFKELRFDVNNGETLCFKCHKEYKKLR